MRKTTTKAQGSAKKSNNDKPNTSLEFSEAVLEFIHDASMRLSVAPAKLKVAIAATHLEPRVFGIIEAIVQATQDETQERRLKQSAEALREALVNIISSDKDPFAEVDDGISRRELLIGEIMAELEAGRLREQLFAESNVAADPAATLDELRIRFTTRAVEGDDAADERFDDLAYTNELRSQLIEAQPLTEAELLTLANARAANTRAAILQAIAELAGRILLGTPQAVTEDSGDAVRMKLTLRTGANDEIPDDNKPAENLNTS